MTTGSASGGGSFDLCRRGIGDEVLANERPVPGIGTDRISSPTYETAQASPFAMISPIALLPMRTSLLPNIPWLRRSDAQFIPLV